MTDTVVQAKPTPPYKSGDRLIVVFYGDEPPPPPPVVHPPPRIWDARLDLLGVTLKAMSVPAGQTYWRLVEARWLDPETSQGRHHIYVDLFDERGQTVMGQRVKFWNGGSSLIPTEAKGIEFGMYASGHAYSVAVDALSDEVHGMGMGTPESPHQGIHTSFVLSFQRSTQR